MPNLPLFTSWEMPRIDPQVVEAIQTTLNVQPLTAQVLAARSGGDLATAQSLLDLPDNLCHSPWLLPDAHLAVQRLAKAIARQERVVIYGDFDADGQTATALTVLALRRLGLQSSYYMPRRLEEGYGLNAQAVQELAGNGYTLMVTVDCGTSSCIEVAQAAELGMDCIVTDHHEPTEHIAQPLALVNPKCKAGYPWPHLAGVGVAFKLMTALAQQLGVEEDFADLLDLVAVGTIADVVPLRDENRLLVARGLQRLNTAPQPGLAALTRVAGCPPGNVESYNVAFMLAPRLNAAGRVADAAMGVDMLLAESSAAAWLAAQQLDEENKQRQAVEESVLVAAKAAATAEGESPVLVVDGADWHPGVVGIVAARLVESFGRPALVLSRTTPETAVGSGRSVPGFNLVAALQECADILVRFGGHAMAAGLTVNLDAISELKKRLAASYLRQMGVEKAPRTLQIDACITDATAISMPTWLELNRLGPFGFGNPQPTLAWLNVAPSAVRLVGKEQNHLRLTLPAGHSQLHAIGFRLGEYCQGVDMGVDQRMDLVFTLQLNEWQGRQEVELRLKDMRLDVSVQETMQIIIQRGLYPVVWMADEQEGSRLADTLPKNAAQVQTWLPVWPGADITQLPVAADRCVLLLCAPPVGAGWQQVCSVLEEIAEVYVLYNAEAAEKARQLVVADWPDRTQLAAVYRFLQERTVGGGAATTAEIAAVCNLSSVGAGNAVAVFKELQLAAQLAVESGGWRLLPRPAQKMDLANALSYNNCMTQRRQAEAILVSGISSAAAGNAVCKSRRKDNGYSAVG